MILHEMLSVSKGEVGGASSLARVWLEKYPALIAKHEGKTPVAPSYCRWTDIKICVYLVLIVCGCGVNSCGSGWVPLVGGCKHSSKPPLWFH